MSAAALRALGFDEQWARCPMKHAVCADEINDLGDWMAACFAPSDTCPDTPGSVASRG